MKIRQGTTFLVLAAFTVAPVIVGLLDKPFYIDVISRVMILCIAAISLNLILGYGGMISFGHAAYIGIGAYAVGIPAYYDIYSGTLQFFIAIGASALFALITGLICLRTKGVYFIMITLAFAQMVYYAFISIEEYGGDDGLVIYARSEFPNPIDLENDLHLYYLILVCLAGSLYLVHRIVNARFGMVVRGSKGNDDRMQAMGFDTFRYRLMCYVISGTLCGLAGWLLGNFTSFISPEMMGWTRSGELIFMVVLGGAGTVFGPVLGTTVFIVAEELLSGLTVYWQFFFGVFLILVVLFARGGLDGLLAKLERR